MENLQQGGIRLPIEPFEFSLVGSQVKVQLFHPYLERDLPDIIGTVDKRVQLLEQKTIGYFVHTTSPKNWNLTLEDSRQELVQSEWAFFEIQANKETEALEDLFCHPPMITDRVHIVVNPTILMLEPRQWPSSAKVYLAYGRVTLIAPCLSYDPQDLTFQVKLFRESSSADFRLKYKTIMFLASHDANLTLQLLPDWMRLCWDKLEKTGRWSWMFEGGFSQLFDSHGKDIAIVQRMGHALKTLPDCSGYNSYSQSLRAFLVKAFQAPDHPKREFTAAFAAALGEIATENRGWDDLGERGDAS